MNRILFSFFFFCSLSSFAGGFKWPNVDYKFAQLYLMNIELDQPNHFDWHIYEDSVYATSKIGSGYELSDNFLNKLHASFARGVNELRIGLGKCYMPRHGIIYYDENGIPVASFTACFECDKISFWSKEEIPPTDYEATNNDWLKAEKQIGKIKALFEKEGYPVCNSDKEYQAFIKGNKDLECEGELFFTDDNLESSFAKAYTQNEVKKWVKSARRAVELQESHEVKITAGGEEYFFRTLVASKGNSNFLFDSGDENARLIEAYITHGSIILPNGISVGMSVEDVQGTFMAYDGMAWPKRIQVKGKSMTIDYYFDNRTLVIIKVSF
ncbi:MAG: hypothetical protein ABJG68_12710 [Crocinitomicaceae bacterium]